MCKLREGRLSDGRTSTSMFFNPSIFPWSMMRESFTVVLLTCLGSLFHVHDAEAIHPYGTFIEEGFLRGIQPGRAGLLVA